MNMARTSTTEPYQILVFYLNSGEWIHFIASSIFMLKPLIL